MSGAAGGVGRIGLTEPDKVAGVEADDDVYVLVGDGSLVDVVACGVGGEGYARQWVLGGRGEGETGLRGRGRGRGGAAHF